MIARGETGHDTKRAFSSSLLDDRCTFSETSAEQQSLTSVQCRASEDDRQNSTFFETHEITAYQKSSQFQAR